MGPIDTITCIGNSMALIQKVMKLKGMGAQIQIEYMIYKHKIHPYKNNKSNGTNLTLRIRHRLECSWNWLVEFSIWPSNDAALSLIKQPSGKRIIFLHTQRMYTSKENGLYF